MSYETLPHLFRRTSTSDRYSVVEQEADRRKHDLSAFRTGIQLSSGELFFVVPAELTLLMERALMVERKISLLWRSLPVIARQSYILGLIMSEIAHTNDIEGVYSTRRQIEDALRSATLSEPVAGIRRFKEFASLYLALNDNSQPLPASAKDIRDVYDKVMEGELDGSNAPDGELFRKDGVDVVQLGQKVVHRGITPETSIIELLEKMIVLAADESLPALCRAILSHFVFEHAHPFYDGNGRTGRYLLSLYLAEALSVPTALSLSRAIYENKSKYYKAFQEFEAAVNHAEATSAIIDTMELIRQAQGHLLDDISAKQNSLALAAEAVDGLPGLNKQARELLLVVLQIELFATYSSVPVRALAHYADISTVTVRKYTKELEAGGYIVVSSKRPLTFSITSKTWHQLGIQGME